MYFKSSIRHNPATGEIDSYYRLVESYRNETDRVCHRTLLNAGFLKNSINNQVRRILCKRYQDIKGGDELFDIEDKKGQRIKLQKVVSEKHNDYFLKIESDAKRSKEMSMNTRFQERFEKGLSAIAASLEKKSGTKTEAKVYERTGRLKQKYPSIARYYESSYTVETETVAGRKTMRRWRI